MLKLNILFLSLGKYNEFNINDNGIYTSLIQMFKEYDLDVYIISPIEKRNYSEEIEKLRYVDEIHYLDVKIGNITKTSKIEKGLSTINIENQFLNAIKRHLSDIKFDLILYPTPPITFYKVIKYLKKRDGAMAYLMLKDIFPQNAVDLNFFSKRNPIYKYFRNREKKLYQISDYIGCMSQANVDYLLKHNPYLDPKKVEILPNSINPIDISVSKQEKKIIRKKYNLPLDKKIFIYGGNLGKPQGIPFLLKCIESVKDIDEILFLIIGNGTEFNYIVETKEKLILDNLIIMNRLDKAEFNKVLAASDIGIISLDNRFTIPNYPSRLLSYMQAKLPILSITDNTTDLTENIKSGGFGWSVTNNSVDSFKNLVVKCITKLSYDDIITYGNKSFNYLDENFNVEPAFYKIYTKLGINKD